MVEPEQDSPGDSTRRDEKKIEPWRAEFLAVLAETSNVSAASAAAAVPPAKAYRLRRSEPDFAREWHAALLEGYENLEMEVLYRLRFGDPKDGEVKFDNATALRLLGLHRETVARERAARENEDLAAVRASIRAKLDQLREHVRAREAQAAIESRDEADEEAEHG